eukprot:363322-Chlamydomonas_euryale.AAC.7
MDAHRGRYCAAANVRPCVHDDRHDKLGHERAWASQGSSLQAAPAAHSSLEGSWEAPQLACHCQPAAMPNATMSPAVAPRLEVGLRSPPLSIFNFSGRCSSG